MNQKNSETWGNFKEHILRIKASISEEKLAVFTGIETIDGLNDVHHIYVYQIDTHSFRQNDPF